MLRTDSVHAPRLGFVGYWTTGQPRISCIAVRLRSSLASLSLNQMLHTERADRTDFIQHTQRTRPSYLPPDGSDPSPSSTPTVLGTYVLQPVWRGRERDRERMRESRPTKSNPDSRSCARIRLPALCSYRLDTVDKARTCLLTVQGRGWSSPSGSE